MVERPQSVFEKRTQHYITICIDLLGLDLQLGCLFLVKDMVLVVLQIFIFFMLSAVTCCRFVQACRFQVVGKLVVQLVDVQQVHWMVYFASFLCQYLGLLVVCQ